MTCAGLQKQPSGKITNIHVDMMEGKGTIIKSEHGDEEDEAT